MPTPKTLPIEQVLANALLKSSFGPQLEVWANDIQAAISRFMQANPTLLEDLQQFLEDFRNLPARQKEVWSKAASLGWYMNSESSLSMKNYVGLGQAALDAYMMQELKADWPALTKTILGAYPARAHILGYVRVE